MKSNCQTVDYVEIRIFSVCRRQAGHRIGEHLEKIMPLIIKFSRQDDDELREFCIQAFESFVRRCPKDVSPHINTVSASQRSTSVTCLKTPQMYLLHAVYISCCSI